jgi:hypothetical protein
VNVYQVNDVVDWVAAETPEDALEFAKKFYEAEPDCLADLWDVPRQLTDEEMERHMRWNDGYEDENGETSHSFKDALARDMVELKNDGAAYLFASTEY